MRFWKDAKKSEDFQAGQILEMDNLVGDIDDQIVRITEAKERLKNNWKEISPDVENKEEQEKLQERAIRKLEMQLEILEKHARGIKRRQEIFLERMAVNYKNNILDKAKE